MNSFIALASGSAFSLRKDNRRFVLAAGAVAICIVALLIVLICRPRIIEQGEDPANGITWTFRSDGTLIFDGDGEITGPELIFTEEGLSVRDAAKPEWYAYRDEIVAIETGKYISNIGADCFVEFLSLETLTVRGENTGLDIECFRCETEEAQQCFSQLIIYAPEFSPARDYAEFNGLTYRPL